jgi:hypothetical protein
MTPVAATRAHEESKALGVAERRVELGRVLAESLQRLRPGPVWRSSGALRAASPEHASACVLRAAGELVGEPRLADAAVAADQEEPPAACDRVL